MRSRTKALALAALIAPLAAIATAADQVPSAPPVRTALAPAAIAAAVAELRQDPNLNAQEKIRTLRWVKETPPGPAPKPSGWLIGWFDYAGQFGGLLLWAGGALAIAVAAVWIIRLLKSSAPPAVSASPDAGERRIAELDIRPDSLPDDVGAAALELARAGRVRDALALLYRASVSSAVHRFGLAIGAQHTEREVLRAIREALAEPQVRYVAELLSTWQRVVYAGELVAPEVLYPLCAGFPTLFERSTP